MNSSKKFQALKLSVTVALLMITPFLSSSLRSTYLYFIFNLLIVALGVEAGLLSSASSKPSDASPKPINIASNATETSISKPSPDAAVKTSEDKNSEMKKVVGKSASEKITRAIKTNKIVKKSPSVPSLFFIGGGDTTELKKKSIEDHAKDEEVEEAEGKEEVGGLSGQELFTRAENFIGNFYKQLKMQREESWNRLQDYYQKAF